MRPRWLLNENFPEPAVTRLRSHGWDLIAVAEISPAAPDPDVLARACNEGRWLATFDRDYGELVFKRRLAAPPVILLLRVPSYRPEEPAEWLESLHANALLMPGHFHIFDGKTVRRRLLPPGSAAGSA
jgi:predicted nuclease of predicted toxin-antitoxin system